MVAVVIAIARVVVAYETMGLESLVVVAVAVDGYTEADSSLGSQRLALALHLVALWAVEFERYFRKNLCLVSALRHSTDFDLQAALSLSRFD